MLFHHMSPKAQERNGLLRVFGFHSDFLAAAQKEDDQVQQHETVIKINADTQTHYHQMLLSQPGYQLEPAQASHRPGRREEETALSGFG